MKLTPPPIIIAGNKPEDRRNATAACKKLLYKHLMSRKQFSDQGFSCSDFSHVRTKISMKRKLNFIRFINQTAQRNKTATRVKQLEIKFHSLD